MSDLVGKTIRDYHFLELIGSGGFGVVYRVHQASVDRQVAVKVILPSRAESEYFNKRFDAEAHLVAKLEHPYIVPLYDYWHDKDGAGLVMRWLPGGSLKDYLHSGHLPLDQITRLIDQIGSALTLAHKQGVVHRDLKPGNILLDNNQNFYLSDFGIAKDLIGDIYESSGFGVTGSPAYLSPEQGLSEAVTPRSDMYSFGVLLYEILTGSHPFPDMSTTAQILHHISDPLPSILSFRPDLPPALDDVIQKMTQKLPRDRYPNMSALKRSYQRAIQSSPSTSPQSTSASTTPSPLESRSPAGWSPSRAVLALAAGMLLMLVIFSAAAYFFWPQIFSPSLPDPVPTSLPAAEQPPSLPTGLPTDAPVIETFTIGASVEGRPLNVLRVGTGPRIVVVIAALHGDEHNATSLVEILSQRFQYKALPEDLTMYFLPTANPDGSHNASRFNSNGVDLNRNWDTSNWQSETQGPTGTVTLGGGSHPFSEPETIAVSSWLNELSIASPQPVIVLYYHSAYPPNGIVLPAYTIVGGAQRSDPRSSLVAASYAYAVGAEFSEIWDSYIITGEALLWCGENQFICLDIELPSKDPLSTAATLNHEAALFAMVANAAP